MKHGFCYTQIESHFSIGNLGLQVGPEVHATGPPIPLGAIILLNGQSVKLLFKLLYLQP